MNYLTKRKLLHIFFPNRCPVCGEFIDANGLFCGRCESELTAYSGNFGIGGTAGFTAAFDYDKKIAPAVFLLKDGICGNADYALGKSLADRLRDDNAVNFDLIIPVPLYRSSKHKRGFNQAELIAKVIGRELEIPVDFRSVKKIRRTADQKKLDRAMRRINLKNAFEVVKPEVICGKKILLIDDICTTGATLAEVSALLKSSGAESVYCASCCKTKKNDKNKE